MINLIEKTFKENLSIFVNEHIEKIDIEPFYKHEYKNEIKNLRYSDHIERANRIIYDEKSKKELLKIFLTSHKAFIEDEINKKNKNNKIINDIESKLILLIKGLSIPSSFKFDNELNLTSTIEGIRYHFSKHNGINGSFVIDYKNFATISVSPKIELRISSKSNNLIDNILNTAKNKTIIDVFEIEKKNIILKEVKNNLFIANIIDKEIEIFKKCNMKKNRLSIYKITKDFSINLSSANPFSDFEIITVMSDSSVNYEFLKHLDKIKESLTSLKNKNEITL